MIPVQEPGRLAAERREKEERVQRYLADHGLDAVVLSRVENFAWLTAGGYNRIVATEEAGAATLVYTRDGGKYVVTNVSEARRIREEELSGSRWGEEPAGPEGPYGAGSAASGWSVAACRWDEDQGEVLRRVLGRRRAAADTPGWGLEPAAHFQRLRYQLTETERERLRWLCREAGRSVADACRRHQPGESEYQAAARVHEALVPHGIHPAVVLVAGDERIFRYRHPVAVDRPVARYLMVVVVAEKWGLHAAATRFVSFGALSDELQRKYEAVASVDNAFIGATRPGAPVADVFRTAVEAYRAAGYGEEWQLHHQGGAIGYAPREYLGTAGSAEVVLENQAFAWNPSITGAKVEDTILVTASGSENLTAQPDWPLVAGRPLPLIR